MIQLKNCPEAVETVATATIQTWTLPDAEKADELCNGLLALLSDDPALVTVKKLERTVVVVWK